MSARRALAALLAVVATAAAVLSFAALRDLALLCGFSRGLAWLLPVVVDAGAAAGSLVWLGGSAPVRARRFARALALVLLGSSVAANALSHGLAAYGMRPAWWVVVLWDWPRGGESPRQRDELPGDRFRVLPLLFGGVAQLQPCLGELPGIVEYVVGGG